MIGLIDCNNFFVSCERLFRPDLARKPVVVLSSNDGCIVSRSQEVKDMGIPMGTPHFQVKDICKKQNITVFSSNFTLYRDISKRVMEALKSEFESYEIYSVDEAFFNIEHSVTEEALAAIRGRIYGKTGIPVSIGVSETKTLAKIAADVAKKRSEGACKGVCRLEDTQKQDLFEKLSCGSIWGIGRGISKKLTDKNIYTIKDLVNADVSMVRSVCGVTGERLILELNGISVYGVGSTKRVTQESYTSTRSFAKEIHDRASLLSALGHHVAHVAEKLRKTGTVASQISIMLRGSRFGDYAHRVSVKNTVLPFFTDDTFLLIKEMERLFESLYDPEIPYKKAGVSVQGILLKEYSTAPLFSQETQNETNPLNVLTDAINDRFGKETIHLALTMRSEKWRERRELRSPAYTTQWGEIPCVKAT
jgi:DNA polymerase V